MIEESFVLNRFSDMAVEPTSYFVQKVGRFNAQATVTVDGKSVNAKSLMGMMMLGLSEGKTITVKAEGSDERALLDELKKEFA